MRNGSPLSVVWAQRADRKKPHGHHEQFSRFRDAADNRRGEEGLGIARRRGTVADDLSRQIDGVSGGQIGESRGGEIGGEGVEVVHRATAVDKGMVIAARRSGIADDRAAAVDALGLAVTAPERAEVHDRVLGHGPRRRCGCQHDGEQDAPQTGSAPIMQALSISECFHRDFSPVSFMGARQIPVEPKCHAFSVRDLYKQPFGYSKHH